MTSYQKTYRLFPVAMALLISACGGGGGGAPDAAATSPAAPTAPAEPATPMSTLVVPSNMTWSTAQARALQVRVVDETGQPLADAGVSVSTVSRVSPHDGEPLDRPVAMDRIDQGSSDATGRLTLSAQLPAHLSELMVVASKGDLSARQVLRLDALPAELTLQLAR